MAILLMILKIIGIILLILLGLLVLTMLLVMFVPVRYEFKGNFKDKDTYDFSLRVSWLLRILQFRVLGQGKTITNRFSIFGIRIKKKDKTKNKKVKKDKTKQENVQSIQDSGQERLEDDNNNKKLSGTDEDLQKTSGKSKVPHEEQIENLNGCEADNGSSDGEKIGLFEKIKNFFKSLIEKVKQTFKKLYDTIKSAGDKIKKADEFLHDEKNIAVFGLVKGEAFYLLRHFRPRKWKGKLLLGTGDPATTGWVLGTLYALYPIHAGNLLVTPDFDNKVFEGRLFIRGKVRGIHAVLTVIRLFINKNFRDMIFKKNGGQKSGR